jgi:uncharacterized protein (DUF58 family)
MRWRRSAAPAAGAVCAIVLAGAAVTFGRADVAVLAVVLFAAVVLGSRVRRADRVVRATLTQVDVVGGAVSSAEVHAAVTADPDVDLVLLRITALGFESQSVAVAPPANVTIEIPLAHSGEQEIAAVELRGVAGEAAAISDASARASVRTVVEPTATSVPFLPLPARLRGLAGGHQSSRPGDGGEFRDIHPFAAGDRLRRIDWKATARLARRPGDLFVRRTNATSDADVAIVFDDADDVGEAVAEWTLGDPTLSGTTSLDVARDAAWSLASAYLEAGDAVSFQVLSRTRGAVPRGGGGRQLERLKAAIAQTSPHPRLLSRARTPLVAPGALIVLVSSFLERDAVRLAALWRAAGHRVLAIDTLPRLNSGGLNRRQLLALRVVLGLRDERLHELRAIGVDVLAWDTAHTELRAGLRTLATPRRA